MLPHLAAYRRSINDIEEEDNCTPQLSVIGWRKIGFVEGAGTSNSAHEYSFSDAQLTSGTYAYRLKQIDNGGAFKYSGEVTATVEVPCVFALKQNYPNPFNPTTAITFSLAGRGLTTLRVYDLLGREVATLINEVLAAGSYQAKFNGSNLPSGLYIYTLTQGYDVWAQKMMLQK